MCHSLDAVDSREPLSKRYAMRILTALGMAGTNQKVLSSRRHGEAPIDAPRGLRGPHRFWALARHFTEECPDAAGVSRDASEANSPAGQARDASLGRRSRGAGPAEP